MKNAWWRGARLYRDLALRGGLRGRRVKTTIPEPMAAQSLDLVQWHFTAARPNQLWVSDFTYVATWRGFVYAAFVIDVFARRMVGWRTSTSMRSDAALDVLEQALYGRETEAGLIHHSDRSVQYLAIRYTDRSVEAGIEPSVGSRGDAYDSAVAKSITGLHKAEVIYHLGPWKGLEEVEFATLECVAWSI